MKKYLAATVAVLLLLLTLCGCGKADLYGSWAGTASSPDAVESVLTFFDNGTGTVAQGNTLTWLYYKVKGGTLTVTLNEVGAEPTEYTFAVDKDTLALTDEGGTTVTLHKVVTTDEAPTEAAE